MGRIARVAPGHEQFDIESEPFVQVNVYMRPNQRRQLRLAAAQAGLSMSEFMKQAAMRAAEGELGS